MCMAYSLCCLRANYSTDCTCCNAYNLLIRKYLTNFGKPQTNMQNRFWFITIFLLNYFHSEKIYSRAKSLFFVCSDSNCQPHFCFLSGRVYPKSVSLISILLCGCKKSALFQFFRELVRTSNYPHPIGQCPIYQWCNMDIMLNN